MNIILFGYRGCGKTTMGKLLADQLWKTFADVDREACKRLGDDSIAHIWEVQGEPVWRKTEVEVTRQFCGREEQVIALGGGTLMQPEARAAVEQAAKAVRIYLFCEAEQLAQRIERDTQTAHSRPVLTNLGGGIEEIKAVLAERDPVYRAVADKVFDVTHVTAADGVRHLIARCL